MAMKVIKLYNIFEVALDSLDLANRYGSFLISHGVKP